MMELGYLLKIIRVFSGHFAVFFQNVSDRTKKYGYLFFYGELFLKHHESFFL